MQFYNILCQIHFQDVVVILVVRTAKFVVNLLASVNVVQTLEEELVIGNNGCYCSMCNLVLCPYYTEILLINGPGNLATMQKFSSQVFVTPLQFMRSFSEISTVEVGFTVSAYNT